MPGADLDMLTTSWTYAKNHSRTDEAVSATFTLRLGFSASKFTPDLCLLIILFWTILFWTDLTASHRIEAANVRSLRNLHNASFA